MTIIITSQRTFTVIYDLCVTCQIYCWCIFDKYIVPLAYILLRTNYLRQSFRSQCQHQRTFLYPDKNRVVKEPSHSLSLLRLGAWWFPAPGVWVVGADAYKHDNLITPWLRTLILLLHVHDTNLKVKLDIQWPWPNFKVTQSKLLVKAITL